MIQAVLRMANRLFPDWEMVDFSDKSHKTCDLGGGRSVDVSMSDVHMIRNADRKTWYELHLDAMAHPSDAARIQRARTSLESPISCSFDEFMGTLRVRASSVDRRALGRSNEWIQPIFDEEASSGSGTWGSLFKKLGVVGGCRMMHLLLSSMGPSSKVCPGWITSEATTWIIPKSTVEGYAVVPVVVWDDGEDEPTNGRVEGGSTSRRSQKWFRCKNAPANSRAKYCGLEESPLGLGYSAAFAKEGARRRGRDGNWWIAKFTQRGSRWVRK